MLYFVFNGGIEMDYSVFSSMIDLAALFGFCSGLSLLYILDFLIDFLVKKKSQIDEKRKKSKKGE